ncbi:MAG TPA: serine/threonine-protein kinase [Dehalococcoidia bacterium]|nr:serine/threonine-protein kinase [Dehalococcoidia bacterium]
MLPNGLGRYAIIGTLGFGSFAAVYRAHDPLLDRQVALKVLLPQLCADAEDRKRFLAEARALAALRHPHIVTVFEAGEADGSPYFAMELVEGRTLANLIAEQGALPIDRALPLLRDLGSALDAVHAAGLVHRDVKDSNVMLEPGGRLVLMDFGIALATNRARLTQLGYGMGTPETAAPEQIRGEAVGPAADIYALGVLAYQLLSSRLPFTGDVAHVLYAQAHLPPPPLCEINPALPPRVCAAVEAALDKDPALRPASGAELLRMLEGGAGPGGGGPASPMRAVDALGFNRLQRTETPPQGTVQTQRLTLEEPRERRQRRGHSMPSPAYLWPIVWRITGNGDGHSDLFPLQAGLTVARIIHRAEPPSRFALRLFDNRLDPTATLVDLPRNTAYDGLRACAPSRGGRFLVGARTTGVWSVELSQPPVAELEEAARGAAEGSGDSVACIRLPAGEVHFSIDHRAWSSSPFRVTLVDQNCSFAEVLATAAGTFTGSAVRRLRISGVYILIVEAEGAWSVRVR